MALLLGLSLVAIFAPSLRPVVAGLLGLLGAVFCVDAWRTPRPDRLTVDRRVPERIGLGVEFARTIVLSGSRTAGLPVAVVEQFPREFEIEQRQGVDGPVAPRSLDVSGGPDRAHFDANGRAELVRTYVGTRRGMAHLQDLRIRVTSPLGLVERQARLNGDVSVAVEPALLGLSRTLALASQERWRELGVRRLRRRGGLTEFESLRDYVPGDDVRQVDWKAFGRHGRPIVREFQAERGQELLLLVDCGRRMAARTSAGSRRSWTKVDHALDTALQIAAVALGAGDRVGLFCFDAQTRAYVAPARGGRHLARLREAAFDLEPSALESDLARALREIGTRHRRRATLLILSDVADPLSVANQRRALQVGARHHRVVFAGLDDPVLRQAAEGELAVDPAVRSVALSLAAERDQGLRELSRSGARVLDTLPADAAAPVLAAWLDARRAGS